MTRRLQYTRDAFLKRVAMSYDTTVFLLVEGKVFDPYFAEIICAGSAKLRRIGYEIRLVNQIKTKSGGSAGGKEAILGFFDYCKNAGKLRQENAAGDRILAFMVDRDAQHITGGLKRSPHLIYTVYADVEAHMFFESDEVEALSLAASLDAASAAELLAALGDWRRDVAEIWRPWIELCCAAEATHSRCWVGFGSARSLIHDGKHCGILDSTKLTKATKAIRDTSPLDDTSYNSRVSLVMSKIATIFEKDQQASLLKGKWLPSQLAIRVDAFFKSSSDGDCEWHAKGFAESVTRCYAAKLQRDSPGIRRMRARLEAAL